MFQGTTIICVRRDGKTAIGGDGGCLYAQYAAIGTYPKEASGKASLLERRLLMVIA